MKRDRVSKLLILVGVLLLLGAAGWVVHNHLLQEEAGEAARESLQTLVARMPERLEETRPAAVTVTEVDMTVLEPQEQIMVPDFLLDPNRDMPEEAVDGVPYIGWLELPALGLDLVASSP